jgi:hypothetical protein
VDKLAKQQACQLFIEQEIEKGLEAGKTKYAIGHEIAAWIKKFFDADVKPGTIEKRAQRVAENLQTNVCTEPTTENETENEPEAVTPTTELCHPKKLPKLGPPQNGLQFARMAILDLEKIDVNDVYREEAFMLILEWIEKNKKRRGK